MAVTATPLHSVFAAEITGVDMRIPPDAALVNEIEALNHAYAVCVFPNTPPLSDDQHIAFCAPFGPLQTMRTLNRLGLGKTDLARAELINVGNMDADGVIYAEDDPRRKFGDGNQLWHTDASFDRVRGVYSFLAAHVVPPEGGETEFADMRAAYDALPEAMKARIEDLVAVHSLWYSRELGGMAATEEQIRSRPPSPHRLVHVRPGSRRKSLYLASHCSHIVGWPEDEGRALLDELTEFATRPEFVYRHRWTPGDVVMWDNLATMHRGRPFDDRNCRRDIRRVTVMEAA